MWELDHIESWAPKNWYFFFNWYFWTVVLKTTCESLGLQGSNQSILREINPEYSLEGLRVKLKLQYLGHLMQRANSLEKTLMLGKIEGRRRRGDRGWDGWMASLTQWAWVCPSLGDGEGQGSLACWSPWGHRVGRDWATKHSTAARSYYGFS